MKKPQNELHKINNNNNNDNWGVEPTNSYNPFMLLKQHPHTDARMDGNEQSCTKG